MDEKNDEIMAQYFKNLQALQRRKSEIFYFDEKGNTVDKVHAVKAIIRVYDENGELVEENFANIGEEEPDLENEDEYRKA